MLLKTNIYVFPWNELSFQIRAFIDYTHIIWIFVEYAPIFINNIEITKDQNPLPKILMNVVIYICNNIRKRSLCKGPSIWSFSCNMKLYRAADYHLGLIINLSYIHNLFIWVGHSKNSWQATEPGKQQSNDCKAPFHIFRFHSVL